MISQNELKEILHYNPDTGIFTELTNRKNKKIGEPIGTVDKKGYIVGTINKKQYKMHRLAYLYMTGSFPDKIDHKNHVVSDNRWENIRNASSFENMQNTKMSSRNTSGCVGVYWNRVNDRWEARINVNKKRIFLGSFIVYHEAVNARKNAEVLYGFHENHGKTNKELTIADNPISAFKMTDKLNKD